MTHPYADKCKDGRQLARDRYADGGGVGGALSDSAADAKEDLTGAMRQGADDLSNSPDTEKGSTYMARRRMKGDGVYDALRYPAGSSK